MTKKGRIPIWNPALCLLQSAGTAVSRIPIVVMSISTALEGRSHIDATLAKKRVAPSRTEVVCRFLDHLLDLVWL
jgi:hypothetical protein